MFHEEKIIDGVLCWRGTPDGKWIKKTAKQLTAMLIEARNTSKVQPMPYPVFIPAYPTYYPQPYNPNFMPFLVTC